MADHVQRVMKPNFAASWDEVGEENQVEETFALSSMKDIPGELRSQPDWPAWHKWTDAREYSLSCSKRSRVQNMITNLVSQCHQLVGHPYSLVPTGPLISHFRNLLGNAQWPAVIL